MEKLDARDVPISGYELIITPSGKYYRITPGDIAVMAHEAGRFLRRRVAPGTRVGLFCNLDGLRLTSLILYNALVACGAAVVRCGLSDIDRQLRMFGEEPFDIIITTPASLKHLSNSVKYRDRILLINEWGPIKPGDFLYICELYDVPGFVIGNGDSVVCPGYTIECEGERMLLTSSGGIEGFTVKKYMTHIPYVSDNPNSEDAVCSFVRAQITYVLNRMGSLSKTAEGALDSLGLVELLIALEEEFELDIPLSDVQINDFTSIASITNFISRLLMENEYEQE